MKYVLCLVFAGVLVCGCETPADAGEVVVSESVVAVPTPATPVVDCVPCAPVAVCATPVVSCKPVVVCRCRWTPVRNALCHLRHKCCRVVCWH